MKQPKTPTTQAPPSDHSFPSHQAVAEAMTGPHFLAAVTIQDALKALIRPLENCPDVYTVSASLELNAEKVTNGDLGAVESLLATQATTTNLLFNVVTRCAMQYDKASESFDRALRLALRAQAQSARTLEILAAIKQGPRVVIAHQLNAAGQQVVHNAAPEPATSRIVRSAQTEISAPATPALPEPRPIPNHAPMDTRGPRETTPAHPELAAMDPLDRPSHRRRKANEQPER